ncbi:transposable element Tc1 transposase [Trichonephila clavata]|uniref:Transposable element Tc1 transposase n=1 Tax=Trichonephila clavata TaxID=2740835 RepID=A0A8X6LPP1_TRICU|nr:transposable element Tc1 transposase [Trichonephila clavata]
MTRDSDKKENEAEVKIEANKEAKLKAERASLRRLFTVAANSFDDIHRSMNREKNIQFSKIYEKAERLFKVDQEIKEIINFSDEEYDTMESYRDRFTEIRVIYEKNYNKYDESKSEISNEIAPDNLKLPKLSLKEYDLMPRSWIAFWGQYFAGFMKIKT